MPAFRVQRGSARGGWNPSRGSGQPGPADPTRLARARVRDTTPVRERRQIIPNGRGATLSVRGGPPALGRGQRGRPRRRCCRGSGRWRCRTGPVVAKVLSADIQHKTDVGGVVLGIGNFGELVAAISQIVTGYRAGVQRRAAGCRVRVDGERTRRPGPSGHAVTAGLRGVVSRSSFAPMSARSVTLETFPTWVRGSASMSSRRSGHLYLARPSASRYAQMPASVGGLCGSRGTT